MRTSLLPLLAVALMACGGDDPTGLEDLTGLYTLTAIDGQPLPKAVSVTSGTVTIVRVDAATLRLVGDGTTQHFDMDVMLREGAFGTPFASSFTSQGSYTRNGNALTVEVLDVSRPATYSTVNGKGTIAVNVGGGFGTFTFTETP
jgi:hypothetical protein